MQPLRKETWWAGGPGDGGRQGRRSPASARCLPGDAWVYRELDRLSRVRRRDALLFGVLMCLLWAWLGAVVVGLIVERL
jgi:hypothetical protein